MSAQWVRIPTSRHVRCVRHGSRSVHTPVVCGVPNVRRSPEGQHYSVPNVGDKGDGENDQERDPELDDQSDHNNDGDCHQAATAAI